MQHWRGFFVDDRDDDGTMLRGVMVAVPLGALMWWLLWWSVR